MKANFIILLLVFLSAATSTCWAQVYVSSYVLSVDNVSGLKIVQDSCQVVEDYPDINDNSFSIEYAGHSYYFRVWKRRYKERRQPSSLPYYNPLPERHHTYGIADCLSNPYSIRESRNTLGTFTLWIIPLRFHRKHSIFNKRAFVFTNDRRVIGNLPLCKER